MTTTLIVGVTLLALVAGLVPWRPVSFALVGLGVAAAGALVSLNVTRAREAMSKEARDLWGLTGAMIEGRAWPAPGGWALGADALAYLLREIPARGLKSVVELGPGTSSVVLGRGLPHLSLFGLEHDTAFIRTVNDTLQQHGLTGYTLIHAPLASMTQGGASVSWYDPKSLDALPESFDVLIVDGPPNLAGRGNRSPAWSQLGSRLAGGGLVIVDDTHRGDERAMAMSWLQDPQLTLEADMGGFMVLRKA